MTTDQQISELVTTSQELVKAVEAFGLGCGSWRDVQDAREQAMNAAEPFLSVTADDVRMEAL